MKRLLLLSAFGVAFIFAGSAEAATPCGAYADFSQFTLYPTTR